jgi:uncharacterized protein YjhX (UPF0386 family)
MARGLIQLYHAVDGDTDVSVYTPGVVSAEFLWRDFAKLKHWRLIASSKGQGRYRITKRGVRFVRDRIEVSRYIWLSAGVIVDASDECIGIRGALGTAFDYDGLFK